MHINGVVPILNVSDLTRSFAWFATLGWEKRWDYGDPPDFGAVGNGAFEIFLCLDCQGDRAGPDHADGGAWMSWFLGAPDEVDAVHALAVRHGLTITLPPTDMPWNVRECHIRHPDGHTFRVGSGLGEEVDVPAQVRTAGPPLRIERVELPVRLEKRIVALLHDLAEHKHMSLTSYLEETLLHTFERFGGGVASPHTGRTLDYIQVLKRKHGIDYDCHASYRFVE
jgi:catechol 2,3-dioxygenase-like lactoylglutathione lyase family enzyme